MARVGVDAHNRVLDAGRKRAEALEPRLAAILQPILARAGDRAADAFRRHAHAGVQASALRAADLAALARLDLDPTRLPAFGASLGMVAAGPLQDVQRTSTMVAVKPRPDEAEAIADPDGTPPEGLHVTLAYLGELDGPLEAVLAALRAVAASHAPLEGVVGGYGEFRPPGCGILLPDVPGLVELRVAATEALEQAGIGYGRDHGFQPHMTVDGSPEDGEIDAMLERASGAPLHFDDLLVVRGDLEVHVLPLTGVRPVTAAGVPGEPPRWHKPAPDELVDADALVQSLRTKTDPVRMAVVRSTMGKSLEQAGIAFDVTNPLTAKVLAQAGSQIVEVTDTTKANVMRIVGRSYEQGLSIPDTATAIRAGMREQSYARAVTIARTELAGAVNGGSLAATQIVEQETGAGYVKRWLTAPGAPFPRHDTYEGLDGQTAPLDGYFDVGGSQLQFPGDPDGDPGETINCFPASTLIETPGLRAITRRRYAGDLVRVRFADGDELAGTPNHPVLRADGSWIPLGLLERGDHLVRARLRREHFGAPDPDALPAEIGEAFRLTNAATAAERVDGRPADFHGDGSDGEVDVVALDRYLFADGEVASDEEIAEFGLAAASAARHGASRGLGALGMGDIVGQRFSWPTTRGVRGRGESETFQTGHSHHPEMVGVGASAHGQAQFSETADHGRTSHAEVLADREDALTALVSLTEIIQVDQEPFHGDVYNLDSGEGWYTAGSIVCRNCRCTLVYDTPEGQQEGDAESGIDLPAEGSSSGDSGGDGSGSGGGAGAAGIGDAAAALGFDAPASGGADELASAALVEPVTLGRADGGPEVRDALKAIDSVHRLPPLDAGPIPVKANRDLGEGVGARVVSHREGSVVFPDAIDVNPNGTRIELDFAHEVGHVLDYSFLRSDIIKVVDAAKRTDAYRELGSGAFASERSAYLLRDREVFARAYAQWIAERSGNPQMLAQVADSVAGARDFGLTPDQWGTSDFAPVRAALDRIFADRGLLEPAANPEGLAAAPADLQAPAAAAAAPAGIEPASILSIQGGTRGALVQQRSEIESALADLNRLVELPGRANLEADVKVTMRKNRTSRGHMKYVTRGGKGIPLEINVGSDQHAAMTAAHEFGHLLDLSYLGDPGIFATRNLATSEGTPVGEALRNLDAAWKASEAYKTLEASGGQLGRYYSSRSELWARSFAQWAAKRSEAGDLKAQVNKEVIGETFKDAQMAGTPGWRFYPETWQPDDFTPIAEAVEEVLRAAGLLKETAG